MSFTDLAVFGLLYISLMFGFSALYKRLKKQPIVLKELLIQSVLGGVVFMALLALLGRIG